jgi:hypothetical protein
VRNWKNGVFWRKAKKALKRSSIAEVFTVRIARRGTAASQLREVLRAASTGISKMR